MVALGGSLADVGLIRPFGRGQELQADELGLGYMARAGYEPGQAVAFWQRMAALERATGRRRSSPPIRRASADRDAGAAAAESRVPERLTES